MDDDQNWWSRPLRITHKDIANTDAMMHIIEKCRRDILADSVSREILARFLKDVESAATIEEVREKTAATRTQLGNMERMELLAGVELIRNKALVPVIDMLIETSFKLGDYEKW